eukprot:scaffold1272_cov250-Pinguiococcus_pyrenoidosus.AAC.79
MSKPANANEVCVGPTHKTAGRSSSCAGCPNQAACASGANRAATTAALAPVTDRLAQVRHKILVLSGKGGVGKSTFSCQLAFSLAAAGKNVGLLDIDICGPSVPRMLGLQVRTSGLRTGSGNSGRLRERETSGCEATEGHEMRGRLSERRF